nr:terpene synthase-like protein uBuTS-12 [Bubarida sp. uBuTS-12]
MSLGVFAKIPVPALELEHPVHYADSAVSVAKVRISSVSAGLNNRLYRRVLGLKMNPEYIKHMDINDFVAKACNLGLPTPDQDRLWIFASVTGLFIFEFDDHFDKPLLIAPEYVARRSKQMRAVLRSLSGHKLSGLQGSLEDWPTEVPCKEAYLWLLREAEDQRKGGAELLHDVFIDFCYGVEEEIIQWQSDAHRGDFTAWTFDRYNEARKHSVGYIFTPVVPLFIINKWIQKEYFTSCIDLLYEAAIIVGLGNDILGMLRDSAEDGSMTVLKIITSHDKIVEVHNKMVEVLHKKVLELECNKRRFMEEMEAAAVGLFLWQLDSNRYAGRLPITIY